MDRITINDDEIVGFRITISAERSRYLTFVISLWLLGWAAGEVALPLGIIAELASGQRRTAGEWLIFMLLWFPFWTAAGLFMMFALWRNLVGCEVVMLTDATLVVRREVGNFQRSHSFDLVGVRDLRYAPLEFNSFSPSLVGSPSDSLEWLGFAGGSIGFDYGGKPRRFGIGLTETEAARVIMTMRQRYKTADDNVDTMNGA